MALKKVPILDKFVWQKSVIDKDLATPPASPSIGDRYLIPSSPTGDWSGHADDIAQWNGTTWDFTSPLEGMFTFVTDENVLYNYVTSWAVFGTGDMLKAVYDTGDTGIVDKAESVDDGTYSATAEDIEDAVTKKHPRNTDNILLGEGVITIQNTNETSYVGAIRFDLDNYEAQSFLSGVDEYITQIELSLVKSNSPTVDLLVELRDYNIGGDEPGTTIYATSDLLNPIPGKNTFIFSTPYLLTSATTYCWVLRATGDGLLDSGNWWDVKGYTVNPYADGNRWHDADAGASWTKDTNDDLYFRIYTRPKLIEDSELKEDLSVTAGKKIGTKTIEEYQDAVDKAHTQNTDTALGAQSENLDMNTHKIVGVVDPTLDQDAATKKYVDDNTGITWKDPVLDKDLATPPASPSTGDRYIIASSPTGDWSGHADDITEWNGSSWDFTSPLEGMFTFIEDENLLYYYIASWTEYLAGAASYKTSFINSDLTAGVLTVSHNLGQKFCSVSIYDNNDKLVVADETTLTDTSTLSVDLSGYGTISGTWQVVVFPTGATTSSSLITTNFDGILSGADDTIQKAMDTLDDHTHTIDDFTIKLENGELKIADRIELNTMLNAFRIAINGSLSKENMVDGAIDEFEDETGIDTGNSLNEDYDSSNDLYSPIQTLATELDYMEYATDADAQSAYADDSTEEYGGTIANLGANFGSVFTGVNYGAAYLIGKAGTIRVVKYFTTTSSQNIKFKVFRINGTDYDFVGESETFATVAGGSTRVLTSPITGVQAGDLIGFGNLTALLANLVDSSGGTGVRSISGDITGTTAIASWNTLPGYELAISCEITDAQCFSEDTIKEQGSYALNQIALITNSLNNTLTKSGLSIDLSGEDDIYFDARASRTGTNLEIQLKNTSDSNTKLLLHFQGEDGATSTIDDSESGHIATFVGTAQIDTAQSKFLDSCLLVDGDSDYITFPDSADWDFGTGNFTIDFWVRFNSLGGLQRLVSHYEDDQDYWYIHLDGDDKIRVAFKSGNVFVGDYISTATCIDAVDTWYHVEFCRNGTVGLLFIDGVSETLTETVAFSTNDVGTMSAVLEIGALAGVQYTDGWFAEVRITKGEARHTTGFTPSTTPYDIITHEIAISIADTWEEKNWDISTVADADKDDIKSIIFKIINADSENEIYIDHIRVGVDFIENMTLISNSVVAEAEADNARIVIFEEDIDSVTVNTDLLAYVTRDGGSTYSLVTLVDEGDYENGKRILTGTVDISSQPSGTNMEFKIVTANNKDLNIHGVGLLWD